MTPATIPRAVYFVSDSTGITAETLGNALLTSFPATPFRLHTVPFIDTVDAAAELVAELQADRGSTPLLLTTVSSPEVQAALAASGAHMVELLRGHLSELETILGTAATPRSGQFHGLGDIGHYFARMRAVEYAIEHDDGQSARGLDEADLIIVAPSRCGKTPTTMYLALQHGLRVANYPLTDDDFPTDDLPPFIAPYSTKCLGLTTTPLRLSQVRYQRRPESQYASIQQCAREIRRAEDLYRRTRTPFLDSSSRSVEEMSAVILHSMKLRP